MMMALGFFVFHRRTAPYQSFDHQKSWRHPDNSRVGARPRSQFTGVDNEFISLAGDLRPEVSGGQVSLDELTAMADTGKPYPLLNGSGINYGYFVIIDFNVSKTEFFKDGSARSINFSMKLKRTDAKERRILSTTALSAVTAAAKLITGLS